MAKLTDDDFTKLVSRIKDGDCVLFLGPGMLADESEVSLYSIFSQSKCDQMNKAGIVFDGGQADNISYTVGRYIKSINELDKKNGRIESTSLKAEKQAFSGLINTALANAPGNAIYDKLAQMPFYLVINTNPDDRIHKRRPPVPGRNYYFSYYDFSKDKNEIQARLELPQEINLDNFVVYNVYGYANPGRSDSIILNESEFVNFSRKVCLNDNGMPEVIRNFIRNEKICLFLGFRYDSWPLKILLQALGFGSGIPKQSISFVYNGLSSYQKDFFSDEMKFLFVEDDAQEFVSELYRHFEDDAPELKLTRQPDKPLRGVFISKAFPSNNDQKQDKRIREKIANQLRSWETKGFMCFWSEDKVVASDNLEEIVRDKFAGADMFFILGSESVFDEDVNPRLEAAIELVKNNPEKKIVPIYVRYFLYGNINGIEPQAWIPKAENRPVPIIDAVDNEDRKCTEVCDAIQKLIIETLSKKGNA